MVSASTRELLANAGLSHLALPLHREILLHHLDAKMQTAIALKLVAVANSLAGPQGQTVH